MRLERRKFEKWLKSKPPAAIVGKNRDCCACPIANFYHEASGCEVIISNGDGVPFIDRGNGNGDRPLPKWAASFVLAIDQGASEHITAQRALDVLSRSPSRGGRDG